MLGSPPSAPAARARKRRDAAPEPDPGLGGVPVLPPSSATGRQEEHCPAEDALAWPIAGVPFDWVGDAGGHREIGFVAQEVEEIVPEVVWDILLAEGETKLGTTIPG